MPGVAAWLILLLMSAVAPVAAQRADGSRAGAHALGRTGISDEQAPPPAPYGVPRNAAPLASLVVPGLGQALLGRDRLVAYLAVETFAVLQYVKDIRDERRERDQYRSLAREVARAPFGGDRPVGSWDYYEAMEAFLESGQFSVSAAAIVPEPDTLTYNGSRWILARRTYWSNPFQAPPVGSAAYQQALDFYLLRAVREDFRWSWRNAQLQHDLYRRSIDRANDSARRARSAVTLLVANHLLSAIDAFATLRLEQTTSSTGGRSSLLRLAVPVGW